MKNFFLIALAFISLSLITSCNKDTDEITDDALLEEIASSSEKIDVEPDELPAAALEVIEIEYFDTYIERAARVNDKGYEIELGNSDRLYCDGNGRMLSPRGHVRGRPHRPGPCVPGRPIAVDSLPAVILEYVEANFDNATIRRAKVRGDRYIVLVTGPAGHRKAIVVFALNGDVIESTHVFHHCRDWGTPIDVEDLSGDIVDYITTNYPDAEIKKAVEARNGFIIVGIFVDGGRKIVVFDADGNFLFDRG